MLDIRVNGAKILLSITILAFGADCQANENYPAQPLSIIYTFKEANTKSIYLSDEQGKVRIKVVDVTTNDGYPAVSPSGKQIAFYAKYDNQQTWSIHTADMDGKNIRRFTNVENIWDSAPAWSPDGKTIAFAREYENVNGDWQEEIWFMNAEGLSNAK
ncbi:hypothetical protein [Aliiglaciecola sp. LCG003]|uniref:TolB family protein n=1 Tax=Aliiglaciecola sp. LCG003 TaxID=3053655 RepID=UPI0025734376|nr:hypothetical protein [Aliiglaciecola sp. LCG003]WJG07891.1 hypothetical protein QR722_11000 [Aliiglaciecola sp. LCG003]